jgi:hypothetical protein
MPHLRYDLKEDLRDRIGEPNDSSWSSDTDGGLWLQSDIHRYLNRAQKRVARDVVTTGTKAKPPMSLVVGTTEVRILPGVFKYELPKDCADPLVVLYRDASGTDYTPLTQEAITHLLNVADTGTRSSTLRRYEVFGTIGKLMTSGIATSGDDTSCIDAARSGIYQFTDGSAVLDDSPTPVAMAADDVVYNLTDGSESDVSSIAATDITLDGLTGGKRNRFEIGDRYEVRAKEKTRQLLHVYPVPDNFDTTVVANSTGTVATEVAIGNDSDTNQWCAQGVKFTEDVSIRAIDLYLGANTGTPRGNLIIEVWDDSAGPNAVISTITTGAIDQADISPSAVTRVYLTDDVNLVANTQYFVVVKVAAQSDYYGSTDDIDNHYTWQQGSALYSGGSAWTYNGSTWTEAATSDFLLKVYQAPTDEHLRIHYVQLPDDMTADTDVCELGDIGVEPLLLWAERLAFQKQQSHDLAQRALTQYLVAVDEAKKQLFKQRQHLFRRVRSRTWRLPQMSGMKAHHFDGAHLKRTTYDGD